MPTGNEPKHDGGAAGKRRGTALKTGLIASAAAGAAVIVAIALIATSGSSHPSSRPGKDKANSHPPAPLRVVSVMPSARAARVSGASPVEVAFSAPVAAGSAVPVISPSASGQWQVIGSTLTFMPEAPLAPSTKYSVRIPAGQSGVHSAAGGLLAKPMTITFKTAAYSQLRLGELLSQLGYLPLTWRPTISARLTGGPSGSGLTYQEELAYSAPPGVFAWQQGYPVSLRGSWQAGKPNEMLRGAVMAFQSQHHMDINGELTAKFWHGLFTAASRDRANTVGYTYAIASKGSPETLTIWHDGRIVLHTLANTGIPVAPTAAGTYPVYLRFRNQIMSGTNPDGSHYADPVSFVSYFNGGDAVHYFPRGSYGFPQSLGCVELPYNDAARAWPYLTYGSLVTVTG